jgi:hypothetical protein
MDAWLADWASLQTANDRDAWPLLLAVTRDDRIPRRWYLRLTGEASDVIAVWLTLRQRCAAAGAAVRAAAADTPKPGPCSCRFAGGQRPWSGCS